MSRQWAFVIAAYVVTACGTALVLVQSWWRMRQAERRAATISQTTKADR
jgi:hypothetical protein